MWSRQEELGEVQVQSSRKNEELRESGRGLCQCLMSNRDFHTRDHLWGLQRRVRKTNYSLSFSAVEPIDVRGRTGSPKGGRRLGRRQLVWGVSAATAWCRHVNMERNSQECFHHLVKSGPRAIKAGLKVQWGPTFYWEGVPNSGWWVSISQFVSYSVGFICSMDL